MLVALFGKRNSGKNYLAKHLASNLSPDPWITAFADPIKQMARDLFGFTPERLWGESYLRDEFLEDWDSNADEKWHQTLWRVSTLENTRENRSIREAVEGLFQRYVTEAPNGEYLCSPFTVRDVLKEIGQKMRADFGDDYWNSKVMVGEGHTLITDGRMAHELAWVRECRGLAVRVYGDVGGIDDHETERLEMPDSLYDFVFVNDRVGFEAKLAGLTSLVLG